MIGIGRHIVVLLLFLLSSGCNQTKLSRTNPGTDSDIDPSPEANSIDPSKQAIATDNGDSDESGPAAIIGRFLTEDNHILSAHDDLNVVHVVQIDQLDTLTSNSDGISLAIPSNAIPSNALPSNALPSNALPSSALPSNALPSNATAVDDSEVSSENGNLPTTLSYFLASSDPLYLLAFLLIDSGDGSLLRCSCTTTIPGTPDKDGSAQCMVIGPVPASPALVFIAAATETAIQQTRLDDEPLLWFADKIDFAAPINQAPQVTLSFNGDSVASNDTLMIQSDLEQTITFTAEDPEGGRLFFSFLSVLPFVERVGTTIAIAPSTTDIGSHLLKFTIDDNGNPIASTTISLKLEVSGEDDLPNITDTTDSKPETPLDFQLIDASNELSSSYVKALLVEDSGSVWVTTASTVTRLSFDNEGGYRKSAEVTTDTPNAAAFDLAGDLWIGTGTSGIFSYSTTTTKLNSWYTTPGTPKGEIDTVVADSKGRVWFNTRTEGSVRFDGTKWTSFSQTAGTLNTNTVRDLIELDDDTYLLATDLGLTELNSDLPGLSLTVADGIPAGGCIRVFRTVSGYILATLGLGGLIRKLDDRIEPFSLPAVLEASKITAVVEDYSGHLFIGSATGLGVKEKSGWKRVDQFLGTDLSITVLVIHEGRLLVGTTTGVFVVDPTQLAAQ